LAPVTPNDPVLLALTAERPYHLALAHLAGSSSAYAKHYAELAETKHVILDNGVAEGRRLDGRELYEAAVRVKPTELVLPDVVGDARETYVDSYALLSEYGAALAAHKTGFVYVLQVGAQSPYEDLEWSLAAALDLCEEWPITALAISKFYGRDVGERFCAVAQVLAYLDNSREQLLPEIHLLGLWSDIVELSLIERTWPGRVRGCDTCWPFVATVKGYTVNTKRGPGDTIDLTGDTDYDMNPRTFNFLLRQMDTLADGDLWPL